MSGHKNLAFFIFALVIGMNVLQSNSTIVNKVMGQPQVPYILGNWTYTGKPIYPVRINATDIPVGKNGTFVYNLRANSLYHVYFYGDWIDYGSSVNKTDYDVYVYNPLGELESLHTESAGLPEHLGTTTKDPFFAPKYSGNYSILIVNDARESKADKGGTLMVIEHLECNRWYEQYMVGKIDNKPVENTSFAYEFASSGERVEVIVQVPDPPEQYLDMYEVQLYLMANPLIGLGSFLNGVPIAWEPGLYGAHDSSGLVGGYCLESEGVRGTNASDSCEYWGEDMFINYTSPSNGTMTLYHLVLIAENGYGTIKFMLKTDFKAPSVTILNPVEKTFTNNETTVAAYVNEKESSLAQVLLTYTIDEWQNWTSIDMTLTKNNTYIGTIPPQPAGSTVRYKVTASDLAGNVAEKEAKYIVKDPTSIALSLSQPVVKGGEPVRLVGWISHGSVPVKLNYALEGKNITRIVVADSGGVFNDSLTPEKAGVGTVSASFAGDEKRYGASGNILSFRVEKVPTSITCTINLQGITIGDNIIVSGFAEPQLYNARVSLVFTKPDGTKIDRVSYTSSDGSYELILKPDSIGAWRVQTSLEGDDLHNAAFSNQVAFIVNDTWFNQYKLYIIVSAGAGGAVVVGAILYLRREEEVEEQMEEEEE